MRDKLKCPFFSFENQAWQRIFTSRALQIECRVTLCLCAGVLQTVPLPRSGQGHQQPVAKVIEERKMGTATNSLSVMALEKNT